MCRGAEAGADVARWSCRTQGSHGPGMRSPASRQRHGPPRVLWGSAPVCPGGWEHVAAWSWRTGRRRDANAAETSPQTVITRTNALTRSGCWDRARRRTTGGFEAAHPTRRMGLACIAGEQFLGGQQGRVACLGREEATTRLVNTGRSGRDGGGERPGDRVEELVRWGALAWSSTRAIAWSRPPRDLWSAWGVSSWRQRRPSRRRLRFTGTRHTAALLARGPVSRALLAPRLVDRARRLGVAGRRVDQPPAWGDPTSGRGHAVSARARWPWGHRRGRGLGARGWRVAHRRRDPGHPLELRLGELLAGVGGLEGPSRDPRGRPLRGGSRGHRGLDPLAERGRLPALATPRGPQDRPAGLGLDPPLPPHGGEGRPMRPAVASGAGPDRRRGRLRTGLTTVHVTRWGDRGGPRSGPLLDAWPRWRPGDGSVP